MQLQHHNSMNASPLGQSIIINDYERSTNVWFVQMMRPNMELVLLRKHSSLRAG